MSSRQPSTGSWEGNKQPVEISSLVRQNLQAAGLQADEFGVVSWIQTSKRHPKNWSLTRKCFDTAVICLLELFMTLISNTGSSLADEAKESLQIGPIAALACFTTTYMLGQGLGGLIFPPMAESFGGRYLYIGSVLLYAICHLFMYAFPLLPVIGILRLISGVLSAIPAVVAVGSLENMWDSRARIFAVHVWIIAAVAGVAGGPIVATYAADTSYGWRLVFAIGCIVSTFFVLACSGMQESRPSRILSDQVKHLARETQFQGLTVSAASETPDLKTFMRTSIILPVKLCREPIIIVTSVMAATVYGVSYLLSEACSVVYRDSFDFTSQQAALVMLSLLVGVPFTFLCRIWDIRVANQRRRQNRAAEPEDKLTGFFVAAPVLAGGFWWFAVSVPPLSHTTPWASIVALVPFGFAVIEFDSVLSGYIADTYISNAASASAPMSVLRCVLSGTLPLVGRLVFERMGNNTAGYVLASVATAFCISVPWFRKHGKQQRLKSPFAERTQEHAGAVQLQNLSTGDAGSPPA